MKIDSRQREQLFVYPLGLTKTLQEFNLAAPTRTAASKKYQPTTTKYQPIQSTVFRSIHRKRPVLKSIFDKVSGLHPAALSKKRL